jgi:very-short-patch-repair endonuclease
MFTLPPFRKGGQGGISLNKCTMLPYNDNLKFNARQLRRNMTDGEQVMWARLRKKQLLGVQFYRQKPIGRYIVDFFAPKAKLVVEVDGSQHFAEDHVLSDNQRDTYLSNLGLLVLRFNNLQVLRETDAVVEVIWSRLSERLK